MSGFDNYHDLLKKLGKHKIGKSCLYINRLSDVDTNILSSIIDKSFHYMKQTHNLS